MLVLNFMFFFDDFFQTAFGSGENGMVDAVCNKLFAEDEFSDNGVILYILCMALGSLNQRLEKKYAYSNAIGMKNPNAFRLTIPNNHAYYFS